MTKQGIFIGEKVLDNPRECDCCIQQPCIDCEEAIWIEARIAEKRPITLCPDCARDIAKALRTFEEEKGGIYEK